MPVRVVREGCRGKHLRHVEGLEVLHPIPLRVSNVLDARNKASLPLTLDGTMIADTLVALMPLAKAEDAVYST